MKLSRRLEALIRLVPEGSAVLDVGCDHAYVPIALIERGISPCAVASDVRPGPLQAAREHILEAGLSERIRTCLADGVPADLDAASFAPADGAAPRTQTTDGAALLIQNDDGAVPHKQAADGAAPRTLITAGMGGLMIRDILRNMTQPPGFFSYILISPQRDADAARYALAALNYRIIDEKMVKEDGKYYPLILSEYASPVPEPLAKPLSEPLAGSLPEPLAGSLPEPLAGPLSEPLAGSRPGPLAGSLSEPLAGSLSEPLPGPLPKPLAKPLPGEKGPEDSRAAKQNAPGGIFLTREEALFGPVLLRVRSEVFLECLEKKLREAREILASLPASASLRRAEIEEETRMLLDALYTERPQ